MNLVLDTASLIIDKEENIYFYIIQNPKQTSMTLLK